MHFHAELYVPDKICTSSQEEFNDYITSILAPFREEWDDETQTSNPNGIWDWYQFGGRWTNAHNPDYDPSLDPQNWEKCPICEGTGSRRDLIGLDAMAKDPNYKCNGCHSFDHTPNIPDKRGWRVKWPTNWVIADCIIMELSKVPSDLHCYTVFVEIDGVPRYFNSENWIGSNWEPNPEFDGRVVPFLNSLGFMDGALVTIDYHS